MLHSTENHTAIVYVEVSSYKNWYILYKQQHATLQTSQTVTVGCVCTVQKWHRAKHARAETVWSVCEVI